MMNWQKNGLSNFYKILAMPNNYFEFKQFTIHQDNCAMKVCTDSCLFGAYVADKLELQNSNILDIGTGTGLLTLMLAQKTGATIDAVEIDDKAFLQAKENFKNSPWNERLKIINADIQNWVAEKKYNFIISNPPFFENDLRSDNKSKNAAKHDTQLTLSDLLKVIDRNLTADGKAALILPYHRSDDLDQLLQIHNFFIEEKILVKQTPKHNYFRIFLIFGRDKKNIVEKEITIKDEHNNYTDPFKVLLKDYYLHL